MRLDLIMWSGMGFKLCFRFFERGEKCKCKCGSKFLRGICSVSVFGGGGGGGLKGSIYYHSNLREETKHYVGM